MIIKKFVFSLLAVCLIMTTSCKDNEETVKAPELTTTEVSEFTASTAVAGGTITDAGTPAYTERGVCFATTANPTINDTKLTENGTGTGSFQVNLTCLTADTTYYVRAYAINSNGTVYGNEVSFTTLDETESPEE